MRIATLLTAVVLSALAAHAAGCGSGGGGSSGGGAAAGGAAGGAASSGILGGPAGAFQAASVDPPDGAQGVPHGASVRLVFANEAVDASTVTDQSFFLTVQGGSGGRVPARIAAIPAEALLAPLAPLRGGTTYEVHATAAIRSVSGAPLAAAVLTTFATAPGGTRSGTLRAGAAVVDVTPPVGVPLGGFGEPPRRLILPDLNPFNYNTLFAPSRGVRDPILAKALVLDDGVDRVAIVAVDLIATGGNAEPAIARALAAAGSRLRIEDVLICASHTHSGPGALSPLHFWEIAALDLYQPAIADEVMRKIAGAVLRAEQALEPARLGVGTAQLRGISKNRRAGVSAAYGPDTIDPELAVIRVDTASGAPLATVYNFAIHGLAMWATNLDYSADLMGDASREIESRVGGLALFANAAEGDLTPDRSLGQTDDERSKNLGKALADAVIAARAAIATDDDVEVASAAVRADMGPPFLLVTTPRVGAALPGWLQSVLNFLPFGSGAVIPLQPDFMDREYRFQAIRLQGAVIASVPGEAIHELGLEIKRDGRALGFDPVMVFGLANGHMSYITTEAEYWTGGYEGLATLFGPKTGENVRNRCFDVMARVR